MGFIRTFYLPLIRSSKYIPPGTLYALKSIPKSNITDRVFLASLFNETFIQREIRNPGVARLFDVLETYEAVLFLSELWVCFRRWRGVSRHGGKQIGLGSYRTFFRATERITRSSEARESVSCYLAMRETGRVPKRFR
jgi:hypothetical protein